MLRAYKYRIYPTEEQEILFAKTFGCVRYIYNWALDKRNKLYKEEKKSISRRALQDELVGVLKKEYDWLTKVNAQSLLYALVQVDESFKRFFKKEAGYPQFKKKHNNIPNASLEKELMN